MDLSGGHQTCLPWAEYQPVLEIPSENMIYNPTHTTQETTMSLNRTAVYCAITGYFPDECAGASHLELEVEIRKTEGYCSQPTVSRCSECSLCNYGLDCHNNAVAQELPALPPASPTPDDQAFGAWLSE